ncbi:cation channel sperm-associated auxiliary subunit zeta [Dasypus novemcinctus]|uniref:cation channel sperm-associated auxiliary subunit zeta n=1 Tax=Dasypus novemcinctus TaxID=9361 RepID=UPI00265ED260|nr:cation channel sperm-associated auxiliary subunit zeta [Dasypus novemcinctus]
MEEKASQESGKFSERRGSGESGRSSDIRHLWSTATLSLPQLDELLPAVPEGSDPEDDGASSPAALRADRDARPAWDEPDEGGDPAPSGEDDLGREAADEHEVGLEVLRGGALAGNLEEGDGAPQTEAESAFSLSKHLPHRAYWAEQQNRLPLPLVELMEKEVLEILTRALHSYRSGIGWDHLLTKQLQRHVEELKKRRNKRLNVLLN